MRVIKLFLFSIVLISCGKPTVPFTPKPREKVPTEARLGDPAVDDLMSKREGFGAGVTGGLGGDIVTVTSDADDGSPGTLRAILNAARGAIWVTFDRDMTINLGLQAEQIRVPSNVTIDGRDHTVLIQGQGFLIADGASNIILTHLSLNGQSCDGNGTCVTDVSRLSRYDNTGVRVEGRSIVGVDPATGLRKWSSTVSQNVWLNHLDIANFPDKLVAVAKGGTGVTLSHSRLFASKYGVLLGNDPDGAVDDDGNGSQNKALCNPLAIASMNNLEGAARMTIHHTIFANVTQRNPRITSSAKLHMYNNVIFNWNSYAISANQGGQLLAQGNLFYNNSRRRCDGIGYPEIHAGQGWTDFCGGVSVSNRNSFQNALSTLFYPKNQYEQYCPSGPQTATLGAFIQLQDNAFAFDGGHAFVTSGVPGQASPAYPSSNFLDFTSDISGFVSYSAFSYQRGETFVSQAQAGLNSVPSVQNVYPQSNASGNALYFPNEVSLLLPGSGNL